MTAYSKSSLPQASGVHYLLVIDQAPFFDETVADCQQAFRRIEALKYELERFEAKDRPAYDRWLNSRFGHFLTQIRECSVTIADKEGRLAALRKRHWAKFFGTSGPIHTESGLSDSEDEERVRGDYSGRQARSDEDSEWEADEVRNSRSFEGDEMESEEFQFQDGDTFDDEVNFTDSDEADNWWEDLYTRGSSWKGGAYRSRGAHDGERASDGKSGPGRGPIFEKVTENSDPSGTRLKERYRLLVKKLHPDLNSDLTAESKKLWHQVQTAYREKNLEQMDLLLALADVFSGKVSELTSLHQLRRASHEIRSFIAPLQKKVDELKQHRAWGFSELAELAPLQRMVEREYQKELTRLRQHLTQLERQLERFSRNTRPAEAMASLR